MDAQNPDWDEPYNKLKLAWTWLLTHPGASLIYYGDENWPARLHDPDNRQMMVGLEQSPWCSKCHAFANARRDYPQLTSENRTLWWEDYNYRCRSQ